jgi:hypothetical protein
VKLLTIFTIIILLSGTIAPSLVQEVTANETEFTSKNVDVVTSTLQQAGNPVSMVASSDQNAKTALDKSSAESGLKSAELQREASQMDAISAMTNMFAGLVTTITETGQKIVKTVTDSVKGVAKKAIETLNPKK